MKISTTKILLIGGLGENSEELDSVFCFDLDKEFTIEQLDKIDRPGIVDSPIILDQIGNLHLFIENNSGTSPHHHVVYSFLEYSWRNRSGEDGKEALDLSVSNNDEGIEELEMEFTKIVGNKEPLLHF